MSPWSDMCSQLKMSWWLYTTYMSSSIYSVIGGVITGVLEPTIFRYVTEVFGAPQYWVGIISASHIIPQMIAGPLLGSWSDTKKVSSRRLVLVVHLMDIVGMGLYCLRVAPWLLCISRFLAGTAGGVLASIQANLARGTTIHHRVRVICIQPCSRRVGIMLGPILNLFLHNIYFHIGAVLIDQYSAPAFFMFIVTSVCQLFFMLGYWDLPEVDSVDKHPEAEALPVASVSIVFKEFQRYELLALTIGAFLKGFNQSALGVGLAVIPVTLFQCNTVDLSVLLFSMGGFALAGFLLLIIVSRRVTDTTLLGLASVPYTIGLTIVTVAYTTVNVIGDSHKFWTANVGLALYYFGMPISWVACSSIFSRLVTREYLGLFIGVRKSCVCALGQVLGSLWTANISFSIPTYMSVIMLFHFLEMGFYISAWKQLRDKPPSNRLFSFAKKRQFIDTDESDNETTELLPTVELK